MKPPRRRWLGATLALALAPLGALAQADLPGLIASARPSVLPVGTFSPTDSPRFGFRGTGFVVGDGTLVATNFHVLPPGADTAEPGSGAQLMVLTGRSGDMASGRRARVVGTDRVRDLALLRIDGPALPALPLAEPGSAREGAEVALMGYPIGGTLGFAMVTHRGIVASITTAALPAPTASNLDPRALLRLREGNFELLQLDATAYPGNSGGPVFDTATGRVIGLVNMVLVKAGRESALSTPTGISYAVPVAALRALMAELR
ncbi:MAG: S1C family serine protease [Betaproteobacteria bacterium]